MSRALVVLLMVAYCLPAAYVTLWPDTVRDLAASLSLARGEAIPLVGPGPINFGPYAGPAWIWLQAPPLVFFPSFVATSVYVALVASLKFPALYVLGLRLSGPRLGVCMAVAAAFPSFFVYQWIMFFHPNWVEIMVVATLILFLIADQRRSLAMTYVAVAMLGLAVQIHTTTLFYFPFAAVVLYRIGIRGPRIVAHLIAMMILIALWFAPVLFAPPQERGVLGGATERIAGDLTHFDLGAVAAALESAFVRFPIVVGELYGRAGHVPAWLWTAGMCIVGLAITVGAVLRLATSNGRPWFVAALALLLAAWTIAVAVRSYTSFYLVYFLLPLTAVVLGLLLESAVSSRWRLARATGAAALVLLVLSLIASAYGARSIGRSGIIDSRILAMGDLAHPRDASVRGTYVTVAARDALAVEACAMQGSTITLHGELAYAALTSLGLDYRLHCPTSAARFAVFGAGPGDHLTALPESVLPLLGIAQGRPARGLRLLASVRAIHPLEARGFDKVFTYVEQLRDRRPMQRVALDFEMKPTELVSVFRHKSYDSAWKGFSVTKDGIPATPAFTTFNSWIYQAGDRGEHWKVEFETNAPQWVEVIVFPR